MAFERKDISQKPEWPIIQFGDGTWGRIVEFKPSKNKDGVDTMILTILPGDILLALHDIPEEMLDEQRHIKIEMPTCMMENVSRNPAFPVYWCFLDIFGKTCPGTQFLKGFIDRDKIIGYQKIIESKTAENAWLREHYYKAAGNNLKWMKEITSITDLFNINMVQPAAPNTPQVVGPIRGEI